MEDINRSLYMKIYRYDDEGVFLTEDEGYLDPEETKKQGKEIYMLPANSTFTAPPKTNNDEIAIFKNGIWRIEKDYRGQYSCNEELNIAIVDYIGSLKDALIKEINACIERLKTNRDFKEKINIFIMNAVQNAALKGEDIILETARKFLEGLTDEKLNELVYSKVETDLIWIRLNGSIVGCVIGFIIFWFILNYLLNSLYFSSTNSFISLLNRSSENLSAQLRQSSYLKGALPIVSNSFTAFTMASAVCS